MKSLISAIAMSILLPASNAMAQPCADRECELSMLNVDPDSLQQASTAIVALRRRVRATGADPEERIRALRELADLAGSLSHRARQARELGGMEAAAVAAFVRRVGKRPEQMDAERAARRCVAIARRSFAWGADAWRCRQLAGGSDDALFLRLSYPEHVLDADGGVTRRRHQELTRALQQNPSDENARVKLAAMHLGVGDCESAGTLLGDADRSSYEARLVRAESIACSGRHVEAIGQLQRLIRTDPTRIEAVSDLLFVMSETRPSRVTGYRMLAAAQHWLCISSSDDDKDDVQGIGESVAQELELDVRRPLVPLRHLGHWSVEQEGRRPLATCARARRALVRAEIPPVPPAPVCPDPGRMIEGWHAEEDRPAGWELRGSGLRRVPDACLSRAFVDGDLGEEYDEQIAARFVTGDVSGNGTGDLVTVRYHRDPGGFDVREVRITEGSLPGGREVVVLRDEDERFGAQVVPAGDINGDGRDDLLVTRPTGCDCCDCSGMTDDVLVYLRRQDGSFSEPIALHGPDGVQNRIVVLPVGDSNRDGFDDVVIAHGEEIQLHLGGREGLSPSGTLVHRRENSGHDLAFSRHGNRWWWVDFDSNRAFLVRRTRARPIPLRLP